MIFFLSGCSSNTVLAFSEKNGEMAVLTDYKIQGAFITIKVKSNGCTYYNSFKVELASEEDNAIKVVVVKPDECSMKERVVSLQYSFKHLGLDLDKAVQLKNSIQP